MKESSDAFPYNDEDISFKSVGESALRSENGHRMFADVLKNRLVQRGISIDDVEKTFAPDFSKKFLPWFFENYGEEIEKMAVAACEFYLSDSSEFDDFESDYGEFDDVSSDNEEVYFDDLLGESVIPNRKDSIKEGISIDPSGNMIKTRKSGIDEFEHFDEPEDKEVSSYDGITNLISNKAKKIWIDWQKKNNKKTIRKTFNVRGVSEKDVEDIERELAKMCVSIFSEYGFESFIKDSIACVVLDGNVISILFEDNFDIHFWKFPAFQKGYKKNSIDDSTYLKVDGSFDEDDEDGKDEFEDVIGNYPTLDDLWNLEGEFLEVAKVVREEIVSQNDLRIDIDDVNMDMPMGSTMERLNNIASEAILSILTNNQIEARLIKRGGLMYPTATLSDGSKYSVVVSYDEEPEVSILEWI